MDMYHGTDRKTTQKLAGGAIDVTKGGGELGEGFYCGDILWRAKQWSVLSFNNPSVLKLEVDDDEFLAQNPLMLNKSEAVAKRAEIKQAGATRSYKFNENAIWSPVVGIPSDDFNQIKWESPAAQTHLNGPKVTRSII
jgi:hypothetical protein